MSDAELRADLVESARARAALMGREAQVSAEIQRRQAFRADGATSLEAWLAARCGHSGATARSLAQVGERLSRLPRLQEALSSGRASFDQVRVVAQVAKPQTDAQWTAEAERGLGVRELKELTRRRRPDRRSPELERPLVHLNDERRTMTARLPSEMYAEVRGVLERAAQDLGSDGITPYDERLGAALVALMRGWRPTPAPTSSAPSSVPPPCLVVAHVSLAALLDEGSTLGAELERLGLVSMEVVRRLACGAKRVVALDDEAGHTMYEGRARRFPTETQRRELWRRDQHCRFPGCPHEKFVQAHHVRPWKPDGRTDLDNLALLCLAHHALVHSTGWSMSGDANIELTFVSPEGGVSTSRPSPLWETIRTGPTEDTETASVLLDERDTAGEENARADTRSGAKAAGKTRAGPVKTGRPAREGPEPVRNARATGRGSGSTTSGSS